ncbi:MAG: hypothetical protein RL685_6536 [Pseudomonadota bacterium]|jgi:nitroreductase
MNDTPGRTLQQDGPHAFTCWQLAVLEPSEFQALGPAHGRVLGVEQAKYLLRFSLLAPSSHNTVPQAYELECEADRIGLFLRQQLVLKESDPDGREALASVGCAIENLVQAAEQYGVTCRWQACPTLDWSSVAPSSRPRDRYLGQLLLSSAPLPEATGRKATLGRMLDRRSVRAEFDSAVTMPVELGHELTDALAPSVQLSIFESTTDKFAWAKLDELALKHKLEETPFRRELGEWLLPNDDELHPRGMRGREFGFDDRVTRELSARLRGELPMPVDQLSSIARAGRIGLCSASAICVLSCDDPGPATAITSGRVFQRCALVAEARGFVCAVHTAVCHVPHARAMGQATLMKSRTPHLIFRLGMHLHPNDGVRPHSARPRLDELLIQHVAAR